jgi:hypothetical protein
MIRSLPVLSDLAALARSLPSGDLDADAVAAKKIVINTSTSCAPVVGP